HDRCPGPGALALPGMAGVPDSALCGAGFRGCGYGYEWIGRRLCGRHVLRLWEFLPLAVPTLHARPPPDQWRDTGPEPHGPESADGALLGAQVRARVHLRDTDHLSRAKSVSDETARWALYKQYDEVNQHFRTAWQLYLPFSR